jgi:AraC-like DNA-binding protein
MKDCRFYLDNVVIPEGVISTSFGNYRSVELPLFVNCASCIHTKEQHINKNDLGRLDYYYIYVISGQLKSIIDKNSITVNPGDIIIIPPDTPWRFSCTGEDIYFYCVHFTGAEVERILKEFNIQLFPFVNKTSANNELIKNFHSLFDGFSKKDRLKNRDLASCLDRILIETSRAIENEAFDKALLSKSIRYINEHYTSAIKINDLAKMENICVSLYNKHFKKITGISPVKYITKLRMQYACELLINSTFSVCEIANMCGYKESNFFIRVFKEHIGTSPLVYRKSNTISRGHKSNNQAAFM